MEALCAIACGAGVGVILGIIVLYSVYSPTCDVQEESDTAYEELDAAYDQQQRRLRGALKQARLWKRRAVELGWTRRNK